jgi:hypothetical protein
MAAGHNFATNICRAPLPARRKGDEEKRLSRLPASDDVLIGRRKDDHETCHRRPQTHTSRWRTNLGAPRLRWRIDRGNMTRKDGVVLCLIVCHGPEYVASRPRIRGPAGRPVQQNAHVRRISGSTCAIRPAYETATKDGINPRILILRSSRPHIGRDRSN